MLRRLLDRVHWAGSESGFEAYLASLQREGRIDMPTVHEAHQDYQAFTRLSNISWMI